MADVEPITEDDAFIEAALRDAEIPALLPALAQVTGDLSLLREDLRPDPSDLLGAQGGLTEEQLAAARSLALRALQRFRDGGCPQPPTPSRAALAAMVRFMAGSVMGDDDLPFLSEQLGLLGDSAAPGWHKASLAPDADFRVVVIGAGISGLVAAYRLQEAGVPYVVFEKNDDVGGTWHENIYPGCRVDVANHLFSYFFAQRSDWPEHFSTQGVLHQNLRTFANEHHLDEHVRYGTEVVSAVFTESEGRWSIAARRADGTDEVIQANAVLSAVGQLNRPSYPDIPGQADFVGPGATGGVSREGPDQDR